MTVVYTAADTAAVPPKPEKFHPCTNASKKKKDGISINDQIDSDEFPTCWGLAAQLGEYVSRFTLRTLFDGPVQFTHGSEDGPQVAYLRAQESMA